MQLRPAKLLIHKLRLVLWEAWVLAVEGALSHTLVLSWPPRWYTRMGNLKRPPFRVWLSPLSHLHAAILARVELKRGSAQGWQGISVSSILYCWIWDMGVIPSVLGFHS